jgi:hypothetical protein
MLKKRFFRPRRMASAQANSSYTLIYRHGNMSAILHRRTGQNESVRQRQARRETSRFKNRHLGCTDQWLEKHRAGGALIQISG